MKPSTSYNTNHIYCICYAIDYNRGPLPCKIKLIRAQLIWYNRQFIGCWIASQIISPPSLKNTPVEANYDAQATLWIKCDPQNRRKIPPLCYL